MKTVITWMTIILMYVPFAMQAQQPFEVIPRHGSTVELQTPVGTAVTATICVVRVWPALPWVTVLEPRASGYFTTDLTEPGNTTDSKLIVFDNATDAINDTVCFTVTFAAPEEVGVYLDTIGFAASGLNFWLILSGEALPREQVQPMTVTAETTDAKVGEVATVRLGAETPIPAAASEVVVAVQYNATVLAPEFEPTSDRTEGGVRYTAYRTSVQSGSTGLFATMPFRVLLGNASSSDLSFNIVWLDENAQTIEMGTRVNTGTVSVVDTDGLLVNADAGPLSLRLSSMPIRRGGSATLEYSRGDDPVRLVIVNDLGVVVSDLSARITGTTGSVVLPAESLAAGTYTIQLAGGRHRFVHRMVVE